MNWVRRFDLDAVQRTVEFCCAVREYQQCGIPTADETMFPYARTLDEKVKRAGDKLLFDDLEP